MRSICIYDSYSFRHSDPNLHPNAFPPSTDLYRTHSTFSTGSLCLSFSFWPRYKLINLTRTWEHEKWQCFWIFLNKVKQISSRYDDILSLVSSVVSRVWRSCSAETGAVCLILPLYKTYSWTMCKTSEPNWKYMGISRLHRRHFSLVKRNAKCK